jgi:hypothetical protein
MFTVQTIVYMLVALVIIGVIYMLIDYVVRAIPIADPLGRIIRLVAMIVCVVAAIIILLNWAGMGNSVKLSLLLHEVNPPLPS